MKKLIDLLNEVKIKSPKSNLETLNLIIHSTDPGREYFYIQQFGSHSSYDELMEDNIWDMDDPAKQELAKQYYKWVADGTIFTTNGNYESEDSYQLPRSYKGLIIVGETDDWVRVVLHNF
jgi:hypothetical protein